MCVGAAARVVLGARTLGGGGPGERLLQHAAPDHIWPRRKPRELVVVEVEGGSERLLLLGRGARKLGA